jgi:DNA repair protein RadC
MDTVSFLMHIFLVIRLSCFAVKTAYNVTLKTVKQQDSFGWYNTPMAKPERYQLPFDFRRRLDRSLVYYELGFVGREQQERSGERLEPRFVRQLQEEVVIRSPQDAAQHLLTNVFSPFEAFDQEELWALILNTKNLITHEAMIYRGTVNNINIRLAEIFKEPIRLNAPALILSHCHPSGSVEPSPEDIRLTQEAVQAGKLLGIDLLDHLIIGKDSFLSLKQEKLGFL